MNRIVIVGAGQAGGWAAHTLRAQGWRGQIALVGDEPHPPYERPPLSKAVLAGRADAASTHLFKGEAFAALALDFHPGQRALRIDRASRQLQLQGGQALGYDRLILATGGRARQLPLPGLQGPRVHTLRTLADAQRLAPALRPARRLLVVGGGWVGLEVAATAHGLGLQVTVLEQRERLCARSLPFEASALLRALHARQGVEVLLGCGVEAIDDPLAPPDAADAADTTAITPADPAVADPAAPDTPRPPLQLRLADGRRLQADLVVVGAGLVPNDGLAREAGLACDDGILVDAQYRSSDPLISAAGDVAVAPNPWAEGRALRLESWQNAQHQGIAAARALLGLPVDPPPLPWFWSDQFGVNLQSYGLAGAADQAVMRGRPEDDSFMLFHLQQGRIQAVLGANAARELRLARRLIERGQPVAPVDLADAAVPLARP